MRRLALLLSAAVVTAALLWLAGRVLFSPPKPREDTGAWPYGLGRLSDAPKRYPSHEASTNAIEVTRLAAQLGVDLEQETGGRPSTAPPGPVRAMRPLLRTYLSKSIASPDDRVSPLSPEVATFLRQHEAPLQALRTQLAANLPPRWLSDIREIGDPPTPNATGHSELIALLAADALDRHRRGEDVTAWADLEAIWKLANGLLAEPDSFSNTVGMYGAQVVVAIAAKLPPPAPPWWRGVLELDFNRAEVGAMQFMAWRHLTYSDRYPVGEPDDDTAAEEVFRRGAEAVVGPYMVARAQRVAADMRVRATRFAHSTACGESVERLWIRARRLVVAREAVTKLLALKDMHRTTGAWPAGVPGIEKSVCSDRSWTYIREADGGMRLTLTPPMPEDRARLPLTTDFRYPR
jgi:hypothetical protein